EVIAALRLRDEELPVEELDGVTGLKEADVDEPLVFDAAPPARLDVLARHVSRLTTPRGAVNVSRQRQCCHVPVSRRSWGAPRISGPPACAQTSKNGDSSSVAMSRPPRVRA